MKVLKTVSNSDKLFTYEANLTRTEAKKGFSMAKVNAADPEGLRIIIGAMIYKLDRFLNLKNPMSEDQIVFTAQTLSKDFYFLTISEVILVFKNAKSGVYGPLYERLDSTTIGSWFRSYSEERLKDSELETYNKHLSTKTAPNWDKRKQDQLVQDKIKEIKTKFKI